MWESAARLGRRASRSAEHRFFFAVRGTLHNDRAPWLQL